MLTNSYGLKLNALSLDQFANANWEAQMEWVMQLISLPIPKNFGADIWSPPSASTLSDIILPMCFSRVSSTKALQNSNRSVKEVAARLICSVFEKMSLVLLELSRLASIHVHHTSLWHKCRQELLDSLKRKLPEFQIILALHNYTNSDTAEGHLKLARLVYKLLAYYQESFPDTVLESRFNPGKVITTDLGSMPLDIQYSIFTLLKSSTELKWWQNISSGQDSYLKVLLRFYVNCHSPEIRQLSASAICHCLSSSFPFESPFSHEAMYLLYALHTSSRVNQSLLISFVDSSLRDAQKEPFKIMDTMMETQQLLGPDDMELDTTVAKEPIMGYTMSCLLESFVKTVKTADTESQWTPIIGFISRIILSLVRGTQETGDAAYNLCADYLEQVLQVTSGLTVGETRINQVLDLFQEMMNAVQYYCEQAYPRMDVEIPFKVLRTEREIIQLFTQEKSLESVMGFSQDDLCLALNVIQQGRSTLSKEGCHELVARLLQEHLSISSKLFNSAIPSVVEHQLPFSILFIWTLRGSKQHLKPTLVNRIRASFDALELSSQLSSVVLEVRSALHSHMTAWQSSLCMDLIYESVVQITRDQSHKKPLEVSSLTSFLEVIVSSPDFLESLKENYIAKDVVALLNRLVRMESLEKVLLPFLKSIENSLRNSLSSGSYKLSSEMFFQLLGLFETSEDKEFVSDMIEILLMRLSQNYQSDLDTMVVFLINSRLQKAEPWTLKLQTWDLMLRQWTVASSKDWTAILCSMVTSHTGVQSPTLCAAIYVAREQENRFGTVSCDLTQSFSLEHLEILSKCRSINDAKLLACLVRSNINHRAWYTDHILSDEFQHFDKQNMVLLKYFMDAHLISLEEESIYWKADTTSKTKTAMEKIWKTIEAPVLDDLMLALQGEKELENSTFDVAKAGWYLFGSSVNITAAIQKIIPQLAPSIHTSLTLGKLLQCLPAKVKQESLDVLILSLRILRGYLLFMKRENQQKDIKLDSVVDAITTMTRSSTLKQRISESARHEDTMKHLRNFFTVCLKSYYGQPRLFPLLRNLYQLMRGASVCLIATLTI